MGEQNYASRAAGQKGTNDDLDRVLDAALAKSSTAEPRVGLEDRILASLRAERVRAPHAWWKWGLAAAAVVVAVGAVLFWQLDRPSRPAIANHPPATGQNHQPGAEVATRDQKVVQPRRPTSPHRAVQDLTQAQIAPQANPKLDLFPSPQPLSEQEKILAGYVTEYPEHAAVIAQARMNDLRQEETEKMRESAADGQDLGR